MILQINDTELVSSRFQVRYTTLKYLCKFKINIQDNITSLTYWFFKRKKFINTIKLLSLTNNYITSWNLKFVYGKIIQGIRSKVWEHGIYRENWIARGKSFDITVKLIVGGVDNLPANEAVPERFVLFCKCWALVWEHTRQDLGDSFPLSFLITLKHNIAIQ